MHTTANCSVSAPINLRGEQGVPRLRLLATHLLWSVIGICHEDELLHDFVSTFEGDNHDQTSGFELQEAAVQLVTDNERGAWVLQNVLDERYRRTVRCFGVARNEDELYRMWVSARRFGDVRGAYWSLLTHPLASVGATRGRLRRSTWHGTRRARITVLLHRTGRSEWPQYGSSVADGQTLLAALRHTSASALAGTNRSAKAHPRHAVDSVSIRCARSIRSGTGIARR